MSAFPDSLSAKVRILTMKKTSQFKRIVSLVCVGVLLLSVFAACGRNNEGENETPIIEVAPDVNLKGNSSISLIDRGEKPIVKIGPFEISAELISTYMKKKIVESSTKITALAAAYEVAAIFYAERSIADTDDGLTADQVQATLDRQWLLFEDDLESNLQYCEFLGISREEFVDFICIGDIYAYVSQRHLDSIYDYLVESYENRLAYEGSSEVYSEADIHEYYPEYMKVIVRWLDIENLVPDALDQINDEIDVWINEYVTG